MDLQKESNVYLSTLVRREAITLDEFVDIAYIPAINAFSSKYLSSRFVDKINWGWSAWQAAKASVAEWISVDKQLPEDGQKCLVVFEVRHSKDDAYRYINIDYFNEGDFDSVVNWEDQANGVALPAGSVISRLKALYWSSTDLPVEHLIFDEAQEPSND